MARVSHVVDRAAPLNLAAIRGANHARRVDDDIGGLAGEPTDTYTFVVKGILAILLVCGLCGMLGSMVVGNRMAFFSDTMAHCAFAGVALGYLGVLLRTQTNRPWRGSCRWSWWRSASWSGSE